MEASSGAQMEYKARINLVKTLIRTVNKLSLDTLLTQDRDIHQQLYLAWRKWLAAWEEGGDGGEGDAELFVRSLNLCGGLDESLFSHPKYQQLLEVTSRVCHQLRLFQNRKVQETEGCMTESGDRATVQIELGMQELVKLVLTKSPGDLDSRTKQSFLAIARSFYYTAHCNSGTINFHLAKVLFERVV